MENCFKFVCRLRAYFIFLTALLSLTLSICIYLCELFISFIHSFLLQNSEWLWWITINRLWYGCTPLTNDNDLDDDDQLNLISIQIQFNSIEMCIGWMFAASDHAQKVKHHVCNAYIYSFKNFIFNFMIDYEYEICFFPLQNIME